MLKLTNSQLYNVLGSVKSDKGRMWVNLVIWVNSKIIENPDGNFAGDISSAKAMYSGFPVEIKSEIKNAAIKNMNSSAVIYLVKVYGI